MALAKAGVTHGLGYAAGAPPKARRLDQNFPAPYIGPMGRRLDMAAVDGFAMTAVGIIWDSVSATHPDREVDWTVVAVDVVDSDREAFSFSGTDPLLALWVEPLKTRSPRHAQRKSKWPFGSLFPLLRRLVRERFVNSERETEREIRAVAQLQAELELISWEASRRRSALSDFVRLVRDKGPLLTRAPLLKPPRSLARQQGFKTLSPLNRRDSFQPGSTIPLIASELSVA